MRGFEVGSEANGRFRGDVPKGVAVVVSVLGDDWYRHHRPVIKPFPFKSCA